MPKTPPSFTPSPTPVPEEPVEISSLSLKLPSVTDQQRILPAPTRTRTGEFLLPLINCSPFLKPDSVSRTTSSLASVLKKARSESGQSADGSPVVHGRNRLKVHNAWGRIFEPNSDVPQPSSSSSALNSCDSPTPVSLPTHESSLPNGLANPKLTPFNKKHIPAKKPTILPQIKKQAWGDQLRLEQSENRTPEKSNSL